jgi:predicted RNA-binding protein with TRAM domain
MNYFERAKYFKTKKRLGQNFLINGEVIKNILEYSAISPEDTIIEIGPGVGFVTEQLVKIAKKVIAIELDEDAILGRKIEDDSRPISSIETELENVTIESVAAEGKAVAHVDGQVLFVEFAVPGDVVDVATGKVLGKHKGLWFHTIGQRHGLGFGGGPWNVVCKDIENNVLFVANGYEPRQAWRKEFGMRDFHYLTEKQLPEKVTFKIRHTPEFHNATLHALGNGSYEICADDMIQGVAPGQFCVIYDAEHHKCYGSGEIELTHKLTNT